MKASINLLICLVAVLLVTAGFGISQKGSQDTKEPDVSQFPILEYKQRHLVEKLAKRNAKKYNRRYAPRISESSDGIFSTSDWALDLPALPTDKSAAVIVGEVKQAQAQLSGDETNIYSEFTVQIENILKNDASFSLGIGNPVVVERLGGRVRMPSGKVVVSRTDYQDLPRIGKRYVLFLTSDKEGEDFHILTGYELRDRLVFPLDKLRPSHPIMTYKGASEVSFFADLNKSLVNPSTSQTR